MLQAQPQRYLFSHLGVKDGLKEENVIAIQQDAKGYMWIATYGALQRYDGQRFINFEHSDDIPGSLPTNIRGIRIDKRNRLWILSGKWTLGYLQPETFRYTPVPVRLPPGDLSRAPASLHIDKQDHVVIIFAGAGFITYNENEKEAAEKYNPFRLPAAWKPLFLWQDDQFNYWVGSHQGLLKYNPLKKLFSYRGHNAEQDPFIQKYEDIGTVVFACKDKHNRFWISAWPNNKALISSYNPATHTEKIWNTSIANAVKKYYELHGIAELKDSSIWFTGNNLMARVNNATLELEAVESDASGEFSIRYDDVTEMYEDREKNVWVSTNKGLFRFNPPAQVFRAVANRLPGNDSVHTPDITDVLQLPGGEILVSTWGDGIFSYDRNFRPLQTPYVNRERNPGEGMVWCMTRRKNGDIWRGQQAGCLFIYQAATGKTIVLNPPAFGGSTIRQCCEDKDGNMWLGSQRGCIVKWNATSDSFTVQQQFNGVISRLFMDNKNNLWVCTDLAGVYRINCSTGKIDASYTTDAPASKRLRSTGATDIIQYNDSIFVIASEGLNFLNIRSNTFTYFTHNNGLPSTDISNLEKDESGYIWLTCSAGIVSYHPGRKKLSTYNAADGIHNTSFNQASSAKLQDGRIVFGTNHDLLQFNPSRVTVTNYVPPVVEFTRFALMNKTLLVDSLLQLPLIDLRYFEHSVTIDLSTLTYQNTYPVYYRMEGVEKDWVSAGDLNQAIYTYLPPGKYTFMAACKDDYGNIGRINALTIHISLPFWKSWWFYLILALAISFVVYWYDLERTKRKETIMQMRSDIAGNLHQEVNTVLGNINILSEMARLKADLDIKKSKEYIQQIHTKSHHMMIAMDDMLWSIDPNNDSMEKTLLRMKEFIDALNNRHNAGIELLVDEKVNALKLDMQFRHEAFILFKESIGGLVKAGATKCKLHVGLEKEDLFYIVQFHNECCDIQQLTNLLQSQDLARRMDRIQATVKVAVHKSHSILTFKVPAQHGRVR